MEEGITIKTAQECRRILADAMFDLSAVVNSDVDLPPEVANIIASAARLINSSLLLWDTIPGDSPGGV